MRLVTSSQNANEVKSLGMTKRRLEQFQKVFDCAAALLEESKNLEDVASQLIALLGEALDCEWGTFWKVDSTVHRLRPIATWSTPSVPTSVRQQ